MVVATCRLGRWLSLQVIMKYTREQLIDALVAEWEYLCHDDYDPEDLTPEEYRLKLECYSDEDLIEESGVDEEGFTLDDYMVSYGQT